MPHTTLITGAAIRVGAAISESLAAAGHDLVLHYRHSASQAEALAQRLRDTYRVHVTLKQEDLENADELARFWEGLPPVSAIIHNASRYVRDTLADFTLADLRAHLAVHLEAPLLLTQGFMAQLPAGTSGNIIVLGDGVKGWSVSPHFFTYAASKQLWESTIDLLAAAVAPRARANLIALAPTLESATDDHETFQRLAARTPLQRTGTPEEVCAAVHYLLNAPGVTGQTLSLAGGAGLATYRHANT